MRVHKKRAVVRFMFHQPDDIRWFKPVELWTKQVGGCVGACGVWCAGHWGCGPSRLVGGWVGAWVRVVCGAWVIGAVDQAGWWVGGLVGACGAWCVAHWGCGPSWWGGGWEMGGKVMLGA